MQFASLGRAGWVSFLLMGCVLCVGCGEASPAARTPFMHLLSIDFRPDNSKLIDVRLDGDLLVTQEVGGDVANWDPLIKRLSKVARDVRADRRSGAVTEIVIMAGDRVPYEVLGAVFACGSEPSGYCGEFLAEVEPEKDVRLVLRQPASAAEEARSRLQQYVCARESVHSLEAWRPPEAAKFRYIRVDLFAAHPEQGEAAGQMVNAVATEPWALQAALAKLRGAAGGDSQAVLVSPDEAISQKEVMAACRAAVGAGFREIYFTPPK